jgi:hypothetical protein
LRRVSAVDGAEGASGSTLRSRSAWLGGRLRVPARSWSRPPGWLLVAIFVAALTWPVNPNPPGIGGYDISWPAGLVVAAHMGLHWGSQFDYTYGPLGYLTVGTLFFDRTGLPADLVIGAPYLGTLSLVARALCRTLGLPLGALLVFVLARLAATAIDPVELIAPLIVALGIVALRREGRLPTRLGVGIGLLAAFSALDKLSVAPVGIAVMVVVAIEDAITARGQSRREQGRVAAITLGSFVAGFLILWLAASQSLGDIPSYLRNGWDLINGYSDGEGLADPSLNWEYGWAAVSAVALLAAVFWQDRDLAWTRRAGIGLLWLWLLYTEFRHAFVRLQPGHSTLFFAPVLILAAAVLIRPGRWRIGALPTLMALVSLWHVNAWNVSNLFNVATAGFEQQVNVFLSPSARSGAQHTAQTALQASYSLPPALLAAMTGQTVHFDPWEAALAWAYPQLRWDPAPVFQSYDAYTSHLDDVNASFLAGPDAPRFILRQNEALDNRNPRWESPRYMLEMMCRYREVMVSGAWQLLERGPDRCETSTPAGHQHVVFDRRVTVPAPTPDSIVVASFSDFWAPWSDTLGALFFRGSVESVAVNQLYFRFVPGSAANPHVMTVPSCLGWTASFFDATPYRSVAVGHGIQLGQPGVTEPDYSYTVSFRRIAFHC